MNQKASESTPHFIEDENELVLQEPLLITRTTLRKILQKARAQTLTELSTRSNKPQNDILDTSDI